MNIEKISPKKTNSPSSGAPPKVYRLSIAPMMDVTDRHCRYFYRQLSRRTQLYTEMVTSKAVIHGSRERLMSFNPAEHPIAVQLGGSDPQELAEAARIAADFNYDEINLNVGCPSPRVQSGAFGACLMKDPDLVARCCLAISSAVPDLPVTVKCRIGVDEQDPAQTLPVFLSRLCDAGVRHVIIHARKAWLDGLSPKENRTIPPLDYDLAFVQKQKWPNLAMTINGGISTLEQADFFLNRGMDGVMIGRAAWHGPTQVLSAADRQIFCEDVADTNPVTAVLSMIPYIDSCLSEGWRLSSITRSMLGAFNGVPGGARWRRVLSENAHRQGAGVEIIYRALSEVTGESYGGCY